MPDAWQCHGGHENDFPLYGEPGACEVPTCDAVYDEDEAEVTSDGSWPGDPDAAEGDAAANPPPHPIDDDADSAQECPGPHVESEEADDWIFDRDASAIDKLGEANAKKYREKKWHRQDFPGNKDEAGNKGPNQGLAVSLHSNLKGILPERRVNTGSDAVVTKSQFEKKKMQDWVSGQLQSLAGEGSHKANRHAAAAYQQMKEAAAADGVTLAVVSSYRTPKKSQEKAEQSGNPNAVASFSSHNLGLALDLRMSHSGLTYGECSTRPFLNVVLMRQSPVHKWMFLNAARFGWYPYTAEPWHWEYNPPGFHATFREGYS